MKKKWLKIFLTASLLVILSAGIAFGTVTFTEEEKENIKNSEDVAYKYWEQIELMSEKDFAKVKPVVKTSVTEKYGVFTFEPIKGYENYADAGLAAGFHGVQIYSSNTKNGEYTLVDSKNCMYGFSRWDYRIQIKDRSWNGKYFKFRYYIQDSQTKLYIDSNFSDPVKLTVPVQGPDSSLQALQINNSKIFVQFVKKSGLGRSLQIREKGTEKWVSISKSKFVKEYKYEKIGCLLTVDPSKTYEFRARFTYKENGKTKYTASKIYKKINPRPVMKSSAAEFLRYDKNGYVIHLEFDIKNKADDRENYGYELVCRKAGSNDKWKKVSEDERVETGDLAYIKTKNSYISYRAKPGYEYKIRYYKSMGSNKSYTKYSDVFKCTSKNSKFINDTERAHAIMENMSESAFIDTLYEERPVYDSSKSMKYNYEVLRGFLTRHHGHNLRLFEDGFKLNLDDPRANVLRIDLSRADENVIGVQMLSGFYSQARLEAFWFWSGDLELSYALYSWVEAYENYGNANSDYFGFRDVKSTRNGFIIEMNGQQIEVEKAERGSIFWFKVA